MAWLTSLDTSKRIRIRHSGKYVYYLVPDGGTGWRRARRLDTTDEYEYPGIDATLGPGLADSLIGASGIIDVYWQDRGGGGGSVIHVTQTRGAEELL